MDNFIGTTEQFFNNTLSFESDILYKSLKFFADSEGFNVVYLDEIEKCEKYVVENINTLCGRDKNFLKAMRKNVFISKFNVIDIFTFFEEAYKEKKENVLASNAVQLRIWFRLFFKFIREFMQENNIEIYKINKT